ncbi:aminodeoxychorismate lyase [Halalkalibacterium ligniniphilum]|uniref:aminodeoxychorismate lyase n=1 Tax=Halalkalibacterium ligniniphilum TaxID=1134413 RepID=UPI0003491068|nr:aminodeoxychorismate lyase [Halalkalibacterium ligniniphilum]
MYLFVNGQVIKEEEAALSPFDHGYMYGVGLFETFRLYEGHPFLLDDHFRRLSKGLASLSIDWKMEKEQVLDALQALSDANGIKNAYVRWNVSAGIGPLGLYTDTYSKPTTIVYMKPIPEEMGTEKTGILLKLRRNSPEGVDRLKSHHYLNNLLAKREIGNDPTREGIFLSEKGYLAEGIVSNLFWIKGDTVYTPDTDTGILNGITRQFILALCKKNQIPFEIGCYSVEALLEADGAFLTNSIQEVVKLTEFDGQAFKKEQPFIEWLQQQYKLFRHSLWSKSEL